MVGGGIDGAGSEVVGASDEENHSGDYGDLGEPGFTGSLRRSFVVAEEFELGGGVHFEFRLLNFECSVIYTFIVRLYFQKRGSELVKFSIIV